VRDGSLLELWVYLHKFSSSFARIGVSGNSLMVKDHLMLSVDGSVAVIVSKIAMYDRGEFWMMWGGLLLDWVYLRDFSSNFHENWRGGISLVVRNHCA